MIKVIVNLYKKSGKWKYTGTSSIPEGTHLWDDDLIELLDKGNDFVVPDTIAGGDFYVVLSTPEDAPNTVFFNALFTPDDVKSLKNKLQIRRDKDFTK